eukprot:4521877-Lingulodinium_polyedra.AAC.1
MAVPCAASAGQIGARGRFGTPRSGPVRRRAWPGPRRRGPGGWREALPRWQARGGRAPQRLLPGRVPQARQRC